MSIHIQFIILSKNTRFKIMAYLYASLPRSFFSLKRLFSIICLFLFSTIVAAEIPQILPAGLNPGSVQGGVIGRSIANSPIPGTNIKSPKFVMPHETEPSPISPEASKISFVLNGVNFEGNHIFSNTELQALFKPYIHQKITVAKLQSLVQSITDKYKKEGYFLSKALLPPQEIKNGVVKVTVVEGFISQITVQGINRQRLIGFIQKYGDKIKAVKPIKLESLERYLLLMNDIPGFSIKSVLEPDPAVPLGAKLTLVTNRTPVQATVSYDNYQTPYLGPDETTLFTSLNSVFTPGGTLYARFLTANQYNNLHFYEIRHDQTIGTEGMVFSLDGYATKTNPQFILTPLDEIGSNSDINATISYPLIRSSLRSLSIQGQFEYMSSSTMVLQQKLYNEVIEDISFSARYSNTLWKGDDIVTILFNQGIRSLGSSENQLSSRLGASGHFFRMIASTSREQHLNDRFSLFGLATAQYSNKILPASLTFTYGGPFLGRGYDWAQFTQDEGVAGKIEFRMNTSPNLPFLKQVQYYAFYDAGKLWSLIPGITSESGASTGFGLRATLMNHFNAEGFLGKPLTAPNQSQVIMGNSGHNFLGYFQLTTYL